MNALNYNDKLIEFHRQILRWVDDGCPKHKVFDTNMGLCRNLKDWAVENGYSAHYLSCALYAAFRARGLDDTYPFYLPLNGVFYTNDEFETARRQYREERGSIYKNGRRLHWLRSFAAHSKSDEKSEF